jgi:hypothetical protein
MYAKVLPQELAILQEGGCSDETVRRIQHAEVLRGVLNRGSGVQIFYSHGGIKITVFSNVTPISLVDRY